MRKVSRPDFSGGPNLSVASERPLRGGSARAAPAASLGSVVGVARRYDTVSFLSDLGQGADVVGVVRAIVRDLAPHASVIDLTHAVAPNDVRAGSLALARCVAYVPSGVVIASVDEATDRPHVAVEVAGGEGILIGPDNGLLAPAVAMAGGAERAVRLDAADRHLVSPGRVWPIRDIYAPTAAHLCQGVDLLALGSPVDVDALLPGVVPLPRDAGDGAIVADVLWVDHHGDCQLNVALADLVAAAPGHEPSLPLGARLEVTALGAPGAVTSDAPVVRIAQWVDHVSRLSPGALGVTVDPHGMVALVLSRRSAADELGIGAGDQLRLTSTVVGDAGATTANVSIGQRPRG